MGYRVIVFSNSCQQTYKPRYLGKYATCYVVVECEGRLQQFLSTSRLFFLEKIISFYSFFLPNKKDDSPFPEVYKCNLNARFSDMLRPPFHLRLPVSVPDYRTVEQKILWVDFFHWQWKMLIWIFPQFQHFFFQMDVTYFWWKNSTQSIFCSTVRRNKKSHS